MDQPVELIPLTCPKCATPIPAQPEEIAWACSGCGEGLVLNLEKGVSLMRMHYQAGLDPNGTGRPFWVVEAQVAVSRQTYSGNQAAEAAQFWSQPRRFFIPAFACPLETVLTLGPQMLLQPPELKEGPRAPFAPVTVAIHDVQPMVEFIVVAVEAGRKDKLKQVQVEVKPSEPALWILP